MGPVDLITIGVIAAILCGSIWFIVRSRKKGVKCIGCPEGCCPSKNGCGGCSGCAQK